jgi:hypothetical protein
MALERVASMPGQWSDPTWNGATPATFAVVIGVSRYPFLKGGLSAVPDNFGLPQLAASALTAYRLFEWLKSDYQSHAAPLARCWLLLAPTPEEIAIEPALSQNALDPTWNSATTALNQWYAAMKNLPAPIAASSRGFFVFSGHGLSVGDRQILLLSDYLDPAQPSLSRGLNSINLAQGVAQLEVPEHFFFLDACRNASKEMLDKDGLEGWKLFTPSLSYRGGGRLIARFYATSDGLQAYQPTKPADGISLYGQALLEGLAGEPPCRIDCSGPDCVLKVYDLQDFLIERVPKLLSARSAEVEQPTQLACTYGRPSPISEIPRPSQAQPNPAPPPAPAGAVAPVPPARPRAAFARGVQAAPLSVGWNMHRKTGPAPHDLFGSEYVSDLLWPSVGVRDLISLQVLPPANAYLVQHVERDLNPPPGQQRVFRITFTLPDRRNSWFEISDNQRSYAWALPVDSDEPVRYRLTIGTSGVYGAPPTQTEMAIDDQPDSPLGQAATLWELYRHESVQRAAESIDLGKMRELVQGKMNSPLAATIAGIVLLRASRTDLIHDWLANLADWFPWLPDGTVLRVEQLLNDGGGQVPSEAIERFLSLGHRDLPRTADALAMASRQASDLDQFADLHPLQRESLGALRTRLQHAIASQRPGGLFACYMGPKGTLSPNLIRFAT